MPYTFGESSIKQLDTCHQDLQDIAYAVIQITDVDFGISEGYRTVERQKELYDQGKSKIDGVSQKGKHNYNPSLALDFYAYHPDPATREKMAYDKVHLTYIAGLFDAVSKQMFQRRQISHILRWGANWNMDGVIDFDQSFDDYPHIELYAP